MSEHEDNPASQDLPDHLTEKKKVIRMRSNGRTIREITKEIKMSMGWVKQNYQRTREHTMKIWKMSVVRVQEFFSRLFIRVKIS